MRRQATLTESITDQGVSGIDERKESVDQQLDDCSDNDTTPTGAEDSVCPIYEEARTDERWAELQEKHNYKDVKCGHVIQAFSADAGSNIKISTGYQYVNRLPNIIQYIHGKEKCLPDIDLDDVRGFLRECEENPWSRSHVDDHLQGLKKVLNYMDAEQGLDTNIRTEHIRDRINLSNYDFSEATDQVFLSLEELKMLPKNAGSLLGEAAINLMMVTGQRVGRLAKIETDQLNLDDAIIELVDEKTGNTYQIPLPWSVVTNIRRWLTEGRQEWLDEDQECPYLFPGKNGGHITPKYIRRCVDSAAKNAGIQGVRRSREMTETEKEFYGTDKEKKEWKRVTPHTFRRSLSQILIEYGGNTDLSKLALDDTEEVIRRHYMDKNKQRVEKLRGPMKELFD